MSARWDETTSSWRSLQDAWSRTMRGESSGVAVGTAVDDLVKLLPQVGESDLLAELLDGRALADVEPIYVSEDVSALWQGAWKGFSVESLRPQDLIVPSGFALLPGAVEVGEGRPYVAMLWFSGEAVIVALRVLSRGGRWAISGTYLFASDGSMDPGVTEPGLRNAYRAYQSFWRLALQVLPVSEELPRPRRREEARRGSDRRSVTVLRLRRRDRRESENLTGVEWDHRWLVRGHWRNQWYPSIRDHRQVWISPYVKGPDDLPIIATDRVIEFIR